MSLQATITSWLARPNQSDPAAGGDVKWYVQYAGQLLGIVAAFFAILFGLWNVFGIILFNVTCLVSGILQMLVGFVVMAIEAPCCFFCIDDIKKLVDKVDQRPLWNRAALYCIIAIPPIILCPGLGSIFGCGLIFATGAVYGMMSLGKKASAEEMRAAAVQSGFGTNTSDRASIVNNAQPFSFTGSVGTDSNV